MGALVLLLRPRMSNRDSKEDSVGARVTLDPAVLGQNIFLSSARLLLVFRLPPETRFGTVLRDLEKDDLRTWRAGTRRRPRIRAVCTRRQRRRPSSWLRRRGPAARPPSPAPARSPQTDRPAPAPPPALQRGKEMVMAKTTAWACSMKSKSQIKVTAWVAGTKQAKIS